MRRRNLLPHGPLGDIQIRHGKHALQAGQRVSLGIGVDGGQRAFMAGVHGLQHVKSFLASNLTHHDAVGAHTQTVDDQLPLPHCALAFDVWRTGF